MQSLIVAVSINGVGPAAVVFNSASNLLANSKSTLDVLG